MRNWFARLIAFCLLAALFSATATSAQVLSSIYTFQDTNGLNPAGVGLLVSGNSIYGTTFGDAYNGTPRSINLSGAIFRLNTDGTGFTNLYVFSPADSSSLTNTDGANSSVQLVLSGNRLYGTTERGGFFAHGNIFSLDTDGKNFTNLYNFSKTSGTLATNTDGSGPLAGLVLAGNRLYGTAFVGGTNGSGTVFAINTDGTGFTNIHNFVAASDGSDPEASLILSNNVLYGTANAGGSAGCGTVFALNTDGTGFTNLHSFPVTVEMPISPYGFTNSDGQRPSASLILSGDELYGTAPLGGLFGGGSVFALKTNSTGFTNLHSLNINDGEGPYAGLALLGNTLYGAARMDGSLTQQSAGTIFSINTDGTGFATPETFTPTIIDPALGSSIYTNANGAFPLANMVLSGSTLYGATENGGTNGHGVVFALVLGVAPPTIQFTASPTNGLLPAAVQFNSPAVDSGGNAILEWNWNFGNGTNTATNQNPAHTYTNSGTFAPTLTCINANGTLVIGSGPAITASYSTSILNGGFETGSFTNWTVSPPGAAYTAVAGDTKYAHKGTYGAAVSASGTLNFLSQTLATTPGTSYLISFWLDSPDGLTPNEFRFSWDGSVLFDQTNMAKIGWTNIQIIVPATDAITPLQFGFQDNPSYFGLDDISVVPAGQVNLLSPTVSGTNLVLSGVNGLLGVTNYLLMGTNLTQPLNLWTRIATNIPTGTGSFTITATNTVSAKNPQRFYLLQSP